MLSHSKQAFELENSLKTALTSGSSLNFRRALPAQSSVTCQLCLGRSTFRTVKTTENVAVIQKTCPRALCCSATPQPQPAINVGHLWESCNEMCFPTASLLQTWYLGAGLKPTP
jgi:hypothetical protein